MIGDGKLDITNEAEMPAIIYRAFSELGLKRFCIRVNNRKILNGFYAMLGLTEKSGEIMRTVDKLDKIGAEKVRALLTSEVGVEPDKADEILKFIAITGSNDQVLAALEGYVGRNETFDEGLDQLKTVVKYLGSFGVPEENFAVDLTIARGLDYYTGTVYETALLDHPEIGSVCSGGRYDNLAEFYTDKQLPWLFHDHASLFQFGKTSLDPVDGLLRIQFGLLTGFHIFAGHHTFFDLVLS